MAPRGGLLKLLDAYIAIGGDTSGFDKAVDQAEARTKKAGGRLEQALSPKRVFAAIGAAAGAVFGVALAGANQLDAATRQLQADTGMTAAEAKRAQHALAGMYRGNLQGFAEIGVAMASVHNDLGLTGEAADKATAKFLKFSTATGQDAASAVASFDDILDAWNLTAADASGLMDGLIADHQKFGGVIADSQRVLAEMAPAMQAANMSIDDGRALLNLFNTAGIDASKAPLALAKAVKQLKPGQDINDLIAQIGAIEDPTLRGQKAMEIFGGRGIAMSQAFKDAGMTLSDFIPTLEETTGATTKAADAIESGFGAKLKMILKQAQGYLAEFGTNFGDLVMIAALFGPKLTSAIGAGLGGLAGLLIPKVTGAVVATAAPGAVAGKGVGTMIGTAMGAAIPIAMAIGLGLLIGEVVRGAQKEAVAAVGTMDELVERRRQAAEKIAQMPSLFGFDLSSGVKPALELMLRDLDEEIARRSAEVGQTAGEALVDGATEGTTANGGKWTAALQRYFDQFGSALDKAKQDAYAASADGMLAMAQGIKDARAKPLDAFDTLVEMLKHAMSRTQEAGRLAGQLTSEELAKGLRSRDPAVRAQALATKQSIIDRLSELARGASGIGKKGMDELNAGIRSKDPEVRAAAKAAKDAVLAQLNATKEPARAAGVNSGAAFVAGLRSTIIAKLKDLGTFNVRYSVSGERYEGAATGMPYVTADRLVYVHQREAILTVPQAEAWRGGQAAGGGAGGAGGGNTYQITVNNPEPRAAEPDIGRVLRRAQALGM